MFISQEKKKNNIAEYIIYMWQIEAIVRSLHFDIEDIKHHIIIQTSSNEEQEKQLTKWYLDLIKNMKDQRLQEKGHLIENREIIDELQLLHDMLLDLMKDNKYKALFAVAQPNIMALKKRSDKIYCDIETCFNGLFGVMQLKMQNLDISQETSEAVATFSSMIAYLAKKYHEMRSGKLEFPKTMQN